VPTIERHSAATLARAIFRWQGNGWRQTLVRLRGRARPPRITTVAQATRYRARGFLAPCDRISARAICISPKWGLPWLARYDRGVGFRCQCRPRNSEQFRSAAGTCHRAGDRLMARPSLTGSPPTMKTIGMVEVVAFAACVGGTPPTARITATCWRTSSAGNASRLARHRRDRARCRGLRAISERRSDRDGRRRDGASYQSDRHAGGAAQAARGLQRTLVRRRRRSDLLWGPISSTSTAAPPATCDARNARGRHDHVEQDRRKRCGEGAAPRWSLR
jgi:hypothetical protein